MARITVPDGPVTERSRMWQLRPELGVAHKAASQAVYEHSVLTPRVQEAVRFVIARANDCPI